MMTTATKKKERPRELRRKITRITKSRDNLKTKNSEKRIVIKGRGKQIAKLTASRDNWRKKYRQEAKELNRSLDESESALSRANQEVDTLKKERERLELAVEDLKKKRTRITS